MQRSILSIGAVSAFVAFTIVSIACAEAQLLDLIEETDPETQRKRVFPDFPNDVDRTGDLPYWGGYEPHQTYETTTELLYSPYRHSLGLHFYTPPGFRVTFAEYKTNPKRYAEIIVIPAGTRFQIVQVREARRITFNAIFHTGRFSDGPLPKKTFDAELISDHKKADEFGLGYRLAFPSKLLRKISKQEMEGE